MRANPTTTHSPTPRRAARIAVAGATGRVGRHVVDLLQRQGHDVVAISRSRGLDVVTGEGLEAALTGVECIVDVATSPSPDQRTATAFFTASARHLHAAGLRTGVTKIVGISIIGAQNFRIGYNAAKAQHEKDLLAGPLPVNILRATQFHELVEQLVDWGTDAGMAYVPRMRTQLVAARTVAEALTDLATNDRRAPTVTEIAGPREEDLPAMARLVLAHRGDRRQVVAIADPTDPEGLSEAGALLPGPNTVLAGPTFAVWLTDGPFGTQSQSSSS